MNLEYRCVYEDTGKMVEVGYIGLSGNCNMVACGDAFARCNSVISDDTNVITCRVMQKNKPPSFCHNPIKYRPIF